MENLAAAQGQKRLLILGTQFELTRLTRRARERGYYTVVCDGYDDGPARSFADKAYTEDVRDIDAIVRICRRERIDHIVTSFSDIMFECMIRIAAKAHLPHYIPLEQLDAYRRKDVTKRVCRENGIPVPRFVLLRKGFSEREIRGFHFPAILKPRDSYGSRGLTVVRGIEDIRRAFDESAEFSSSDEVMLEEISRGQELNCMGFVAEGTVYLLSISDRMTAPYDSSHIPINYGQHYPSARFDQVCLPVQMILQRFVHVTGQKWGPISTQCFFDGSRVEVCEIAGRMFGFEHELVTLSTGLDVEDLLLDLQYDQKAVVRTLRSHDPKGVCPAFGLYLTSIREGVVTDQSALRSLQAHPLTAGSVLFYEDGENCGFLGPKPYFARYYLAGSDRRSLEKAEREMLERASALDQEGNELLFRPWVGYTV